MKVDYTLPLGSDEQREAIREVIPKAYNFYVFFGFTNLIAWGAIGFACYSLSHVAWWEWMFVPVVFVLLNLGEYYMHRGPMHHYDARMKMLFHRHSRQHHRYFTQETMDIESTREAYLILFPAWAVILLLSAVALIGSGLGSITTTNLGLLFSIVVVAYYITYEWMHLFCHIQDLGPVAKIKLIRWFSEHHTLHHDPAVMTKKNFNFAFPLFDKYFGTKI